MPLGFILQPTYRLEGGRPVVHLYGTLEGGQSFLVRFDTEVDGDELELVAVAERVRGSLNASPNRDKVPLDAP